jgi:hypothetical protein
MGETRRPVDRENAERHEEEQEQWHESANVGVVSGAHGGLPRVGAFIVVAGPVARFAVVVRPVSGTVADESGCCTRTRVGAAVLDSALASYPMVRQVAKVGGAVAIAVFGRRHPIASAAAIGALAGSQGYTLGTKLAGGMIAHTPAEAVKGLGEMTQTYPELGALLSGGVGALLSGPDDIDQVARNYGTALSNMSDNDDY